MARALRPCAEMSHGAAGMSAGATDARLFEVGGDAVEVGGGELAEGTEFAEAGLLAGEAAHLAKALLEAGLEGDDGGSETAVEFLAGFLKVGAKSLDGGANAGGVFRDDGDELAGDIEGFASDDLGRDPAIELGRDMSNLREAEVDGAEFLIIVNDGFRAGPVETEVLVAELLPRKTKTFVGAGFADGADAFGLGGRTLVGDKAERLTAANPCRGIEFG